MQLLWSSHSSSQHIFVALTVTIRLPDVDRACVVQHELVDSEEVIRPLVSYDEVELDKPCVVASGVKDDAYPAGIGITIVVSENTNVLVVMYEGAAVN